MANLDSLEKKSVDPPPTIIQPTDKFNELYDEFNNVNKTPLILLTLLAAIPMAILIILFFCIGL